MRAPSYWLVMVVVCSVRLALSQADPVEVRAIVWVAALFFGGLACEGLAHDTKPSAR